MNAVAQPSANGLRETRVVTQPPRPLQKKLNLTRLFVDKDRVALFWFSIAVAAILFALIQPYYFISKFKERERVVIIDPANTYYVAPIMQFQEAKELHAQQATLATMALLDRNPKGFDHPELLKQMFLKASHEKAQTQLSTESAELDAKQLHQKSEISEIKILETRENYVLTQVTGQLVRTGVFQEKAFSEGVPFRLALKMARNPDMTRNGRFPTAVMDFKYETGQ